MVKLALSIFGLLVSLASMSRADVNDPLDPFDAMFEKQIDNKDDDIKTPEQLMDEAEYLLDDERFLDARTKLLKALEKDPKAYRAHMLLAGYYLVHVGHYKLALKYTKRALSLIEEIHGKPPFSDLTTKTEHAQALYLLSQVRLNLDNYEGALAVLDEYASYEYFQGWYPGTRAWILMKLGNLEEAIRVARLGILLGAEAGRTLNMLGILLSMTGERQQSLRVFDEAVRYEMSLGKLGQPATPLNNAGEVYKETFLEDKAERAWIKATGLPDGCEHVLPSLNLALLYIDQLNFERAKSTIDAFESCVAQYPLRSEEEHRALVHFVRGRIDLHTGNVDSAISHLEVALEKRQWFGKIGTSQEDLEAGAMITLAQALRRKNARVKFYQQTSLSERINEWKDSWFRWIKSRWLFRRARQILVDDLNNLEDLNIRHTDSMVEYPTFGEVLAGIPHRALKRRVESELEQDRRSQAKAYYNAYLAESLLNTGRTKDGIDLLNKLQTSMRSQYDDLLRLHTTMLRLASHKPGSDGYRKLAYEAYSLSRPALANYGFRLPVSYLGDNSVVRNALSDSGFILTESDPPLPCAISSTAADNEQLLKFSCPYNYPNTMSAKGKSVEEAVNGLMDQVFTVKLK